MENDYLAVVTQHSHKTLADTIGIQFLYADPAYITAQLTIAPHIKQMYGYLHGGAVMSLLDSIAGAGSTLNLKPGESFITLEFKINFLRSAHQGKVRGEAKAVHLGRRTHIWQAEAYDQQNRKMAIATLTQMIIEPRAESIAFQQG